MLTDTKNPYNSPVQLLRLILLNQMSLQEARVNIYNQKWDIPTDDKIFISVGFMASKVYASRNENYVLEGVYKSRQLLNVQEIWDINIFSRSTEALFRKEEVVMALTSQYAQQIQEKYNFSIGRIPASFNDLSDLEGSARIYRFGINVPVLAWYKKEKTADYFDSFSAEVYTEYAPVIAFEQPTT